MFTYRSIQQAPRLHIQRNCQLLNDLNRWIALTKLNITDVGSMDIGAMRKFFLRKPHSKAQSFYIGTKALANFHRLDFAPMSLISLQTIVYITLIGSIGVGSFVVHGGSVPKGKGELAWGNLLIPNKRGGNENLATTDLIGIEIATQEKQKKLLGTAGAGIVGLVTLGPLGAIGGMLIGGNSSKVTFIATLRDRRSFLATSDAKTFSKLQAIALQNEAEAAEVIGRPAPHFPDGQELGLTKPAKIESECADAKSAFGAAGWEARELPTKSADETAIIYGWQGRRSVSVGFCANEVDCDKIEELASTIRDYDDHGLILILGSSISKRAKKTGRRLRTQVGLLGATKNAIDAAINVSALHQKQREKSSSWKI